MTKKDYERAAEIAQGRVLHAGLWVVAPYIVDAFVQLFREENPRFDEARFRAACVPGHRYA